MIPVHPKGMVLHLLRQGVRTSAGMFRPPQTWGHRKVKPPLGVLQPQCWFCFVIILLFQCTHSLENTPVLGFGRERGVTLHDFVQK